MKKVCDVAPIIFNDYLVISLSKDWIRYFEKIPNFSVWIDNKGKLLIRSMSEIKFSNKRKNDE